MGDGVVDEFVALFVFLETEKFQAREEGEKIVAVRKERELLTSVVTSRFRYSIQTRIGEFIGPEYLCYGYDENLRRRQKLG
jgi:hypothetical protein